MDSSCCSEPVSCAAVEEDGTIVLVIVIFDDSDKVGTDVVLLHGCTQSCLPNPVKSLLEVCEDMVEALLVPHQSASLGHFQSLLVEHFMF